MGHQDAFSDHPFAGGPYVMGVLNVTPDSFSDGGSFIDADKAIKHGLDLIEQGADIIDIGGESTRPGAKPVDMSVEIERILPVIKVLKDRIKWISVDTRNAATMRAALAAGANIVNDISALMHDPESMAVVAQAGVPVILMHAQGTPQSMQNNPIYNNVVEDIFEFLKERVGACKTNRIDPRMMICDPGIGFGKTLEHNLIILRDIKRFHDLGVPMMLGTSRKSFIGKISNDEPAHMRLGGSLSSVIWGYSQGVKIFRVHDVAETVQALKIYDAISTGA
jgi:dihydropteroate synthase